MKYPFPKIDLHYHLDGAMVAETAYRLAQERNLDYGSFEEFLKRTQVPENCRDVFEFLSKFDVPTAILQDYEALYETTYTCIKQAKEEGLRYLEIRFAPQLHTEKGMSQQRAIDAVVDGAAKAMKDFVPIRVGIILCAMILPGYPNKQANMETVRLAMENYGKGVVGLDLAGGEDLVPMSEYRDLFEEYHQKGYPLTIHAGDNGLPQNVATVIDYGATRVGHGHRCIEDEEVLRKVIETGTALEICLTSNIQCRTEPSYQEHPARKLYDLGVKVTLNTDDKAISGINLDYEYDRAMEELGFTYNDLIRMNINSVEASFMAEKEKAPLIEELESYLQ